MASTGLPPGWEVRHSNSKNLPYYFNPATKESIWEVPPGTDPEALKAYMAKHAPSAGQSSRRNGDSGSKIRAAHLLVKHRESRRPSSWRESNITRSKDEARQMLESYDARIRDGSASLQDLAVTESDCSSHTKRGDLGFFGRGDMQKPFENAAFALEPGQISSIVETDSGLHIIQRLE